MERTPETAWSVPDAASARRRRRSSSGHGAGSAGAVAAAEADSTVEVEQLFREHARRVFRLARALGATDPEDVVQDAFLALSRRIGSVPEGPARVAYLNRCVVNAVRDRQRHRGRRHQLGAVEDHVGTVESAEQTVGRGESEREVVAALGRIGRRQREALVLRYWGGLDYAGIAAAMGVRTGTVKSLISRGHDALGNHLEGR